MSKLFKTVLLASFLIGFSAPSFAQDAAVDPAAQAAQGVPAEQTVPADQNVPAEQTPAEQAAVPQLDQYIVYLQTEWARINYQVTDPKVKQQDIAELEKYAAGVTSSFADRAEPKIWEAIILSTDAGITKSISGLPKLKNAKKLLEASLEQDPKALNSSAYTSLGSLYYQVPGWPISFGDKDKAGKLLALAIQTNPDDIDANYFYGDYLIETGKYSEALQALNHGLTVPDRPGRDVADAGRRQDIKTAIAKAEAKLGSGGAQKSNN